MYKSVAATEAGIETSADTTANFAEPRCITSEAT